MQVVLSPGRHGTAAENLFGLLLLSNAGIEWNRLYRRCSLTAMKGLILYRKFRIVGHQGSAEETGCRVRVEARRLNRHFKSSPAMCNLLEVCRAILSEKLYMDQLSSLGEICKIRRLRWRSKRSGSSEAWKVADLEIFVWLSPSSIGVDCKEIR